MTRNLETADTIVKLVLATLTIALFSVNLIAGPFAFSLVVLSVLVLAIYGVRLLHRRRSSTHSK